MNLLTNREYLGLTVPFMLSTMTQPLMGAVNTAVMGQLPDPKYIAAVSLGAILFNNLYWLYRWNSLSAMNSSTWPKNFLIMKHNKKELPVHF